MGCRGKQSDGGMKISCPLRDNGQMQEFILRSAKEFWPKEFWPHEITIEDAGECEYSLYPASNAKGKVRCCNLEVDEDREIEIFLCRDSTEVIQVKDWELMKAAGKDPYRAPIMSAYGNVLLVYWGVDENQSVRQFMNSVVIDTREAMKRALDWQQWLAGRGIMVEIPEDGFSLRNESLSYYSDVPCQALPFSINGHEIELLCFEDSAKARTAKEDLTHLAEVSELREGFSFYAAYGPYGNMLVMSLSEQIEPFITGFWLQ